MSSFNHVCSFHIYKKNGVVASFGSFFFFFLNELSCSCCHTNSTKTQILHRSHFHNCLSGMGYRSQMRDQVQRANKGLFYKPESSQTVQSSYANNQEFQRWSKSCPWAGVGRARGSLGWSTWTAGRNRSWEVSEGQIQTGRSYTEGEGTGTHRNRQRRTMTVRGLWESGAEEETAWETAINQPVQSSKQDWVWLGFMPGNKGCAWLSAGDSNLQVRRTRGRVIDNILWLIEND